MAQLSLGQGGTLERTELNKKIDDSVEELARRIASHKLGLWKDVRGETLPYSEWKRSIAEARRILNL